jgi:glyoxylate carboligase
VTSAVAKRARIIPGMASTFSTPPPTQILCGTFIMVATDTVAGDGAFSYTIGELATQAEYNQRVVNVLINNGKLGWIQLWQEIYFWQRAIGQSRKPDL